MPDPTPSPDPKPAPTDAKPWFDGIEPEVLGHWDNKGWKYKESPKDLAVELTKAWKGLERHFGAPADQIVKLPSKPDDEAGWKAVHQRLGMPAEAKDYDLSSVKFNGADLEQGFVDTMRSTLHKARVPRDLAPGIVKDVVAYLENADQAEATERTTKLAAERSELQRQWGTNYEFNRLTAMQGAKRLGVDEATVQKLEGAVGFSKVMEMFRRVGAGTSEDTFKDVDGGTGAPTTLNGAVARREQLLQDKDWTARWLKGGVAEKQEMANLIALISGEAA